MYEKYERKPYYECFTNFFLQSPGRGHSLFWLIIVFTGIVSCSAGLRSSCAKPVSHSANMYTLLIQYN